MENNLLVRNGVKKFILRFDFQKNPSFYDFSNIVNKCSHLFDRVEQINRTNFHLDVTKDNPNIEKKIFVDYKLILENKKLNVTFSGLDQAFWLETSSYKDNATYKDITNQILDFIFDNIIDVKFNRIGMRFINYFEAKDKAGIKKILNKNTSQNVLNMISNECISRALCQEEYNFEISKLRIIYGVINKFFPSTIKTYDISIDIDSYDDSPKIERNSYNSIDSLNHNAYNAFVNCINNKLLESLK